MKTRASRKVVHEVPDKADELDNSLRLLTAAAAILGPTTVNERGEVGREYRDKLLLVAENLGRVASTLTYRMEKSEQPVLDPYLESMIGAAASVIGPGAFNFQTGQFNPEYLRLLPFVASGLSAVAAQNAHELAKSFTENASARKVWAVIRIVEPNTGQDGRNPSGKTRVIYENLVTPSKRPSQKYSHSILHAEVTRTPFPNKQTGTCEIASAIYQGHQYSASQGIAHIAELTVVQVDIDPSGASRGFQEIAAYQWRRELPDFVLKSIAEKQSHRRDLSDYITRCLSSGQGGRQELTDYVVASVTGTQMPHQ